MSDAVRKGGLLSRMTLMFGRAIVTGLALYGAKKLYDDYFKPGLIKGVKKVNKTQSRHDIEDTSSSIQDDALLEDRLIVQYEQCRLIHLASHELNMTVLKQVSEHLNRCLEGAWPQIRFGPMEPHVSACMLSEVTGQCYTISLPMLLENEVWSCLRGSDTALSEAHDSYLIRRINCQFFRLGSHPLDRYVIGQYLSSEKLLIALRDLFLIMDTDRETRFKLEAVVDGNNILFDVEFLGGDFRVRISPCITLNHTKVLPSKVHETFWQKCTFDAERQFLEMLPRDDLVSLNCILSCTRQDLFLKNFQEEVFVNVWLSLKEQDVNWNCRSVSERFVYVIIAFCNALEIGILPQFFNQSNNLLLEYSERTLEGTAIYLQQMIEEERYGDLIV